MLVLHHLLYLLAEGPLVSPSVKWGVCSACLQVWLQGCGEPRTWQVLSRLGSAFLPRFCFLLLS